MIEFGNIETAIGTKVKTKLNHRRGTMGMLIADRYLDNRRSNVTGVVKGFAPGHGGDVWWVEHDEDKNIAAYCTDEMFELEEAQAANSN